MTYLITDHNALGTCVMVVENHSPGRTWSHLRVIEEVYKISYETR